MIHLMLIIVTALVSLPYAGLLGNSGEGAFSFLESFRAPEESAEASAGVAKASGVDYLERNPAGIFPQNKQTKYGASYTFTERKQIQANLMSQFSTAHYNHAWQLSYKQIPAIEGLDAFGEKTHQKHTPFHLAFNHGISWQGGKHWWVGHSAKVAFSQIAQGPKDLTAIGLSGSLGLRWRSNHYLLEVGTALQNVGRQFRAYTIGGESDRLYNSSWVTGFSKRFTTLPRLKLSLDLDLPFYADLRTRLGLEYTYATWLQVKTGYAPTLNDLNNIFRQLQSKDVSDQPSEKDWPFAIGAILNFKPLKLSYSLEFDPFLPWVHKLQFLYSLP